MASPPELGQLWGVWAPEAPEAVLNATEINGAVTLVAYYLQPDTLAKTLDRELTRLAPGANVLAAHWLHPVADYPITGDQANAIIARTPGLTSLGRYQDADVIVEVFDTDDRRSVAAREEVPGAR